jgi:hypothetical protein
MLLSRICFSFRAEWSIIDCSRFGILFNFKIDSNFREFLHLFLHKHFTFKLDFVLMFLLHFHQQHKIKMFFRFFEFGQKPIYRKPFKIR